MRFFVALALTVAHALLVGLAGRLPDAFAAVLAATVYGPLWLASALGLPVFGPAASGGWPHPNLLGWALLGLVWFGAWWLGVGLLYRLRA